MKEKIKILHITEAFGGGICTYFRNVLPQLVERDFDVTVICSIDRRCPSIQATLEVLNCAGVKVFIVPMARGFSLLKDLMAFCRILQLIRNLNSDIVHTHCSKAGFWGRVAAYLTKTKQIYHTPHCFSFARTKGYFRKKAYIILEKILGRITSEIVAVSKSEYDLAVNNMVVPNFRCRVINNGLPASETHNLDSFELPAGYENSRKVVMVCRLVEYKGIKRMLMAAKLLKTKDVKVLIIGQGKQQSSLTKDIERQKLRDRVFLLGFVHNIEQVYKNADIVVSCSDAEGLPYALVEALKYKKPIIATDVVGNNDVIKNNENGIVTSIDPFEIAKAIDSLLSDEDQCNGLIYNGYKHFINNYSLDCQIMKLAELYRC